MHPPGAGPDFTRLCDGCNACVEACPEGILLSDRRTGPRVEFSLGACSFCTDCVTACPTGALQLADVALWPWRATVTTSCLSMQGISCRACEDVCDARAIRFRLKTGGRADPVIDLDQCSGCGACAYACPEGAIHFAVPEQKNAETEAAS